MSFAVVKGLVTALPVILRPKTLWPSHYRGHPPPVALYKISPFMWCVLLELASKSVKTYDWLLETQGLGCPFPSPHTSLPLVWYCSWVWKAPKIFDCSILIQAWNVDVNYQELSNHEGTVTEKVSIDFCEICVLCRGKLEGYFSSFDIWLHAPWSRLAAGWGSG